VDWASRTFGFACQGARFRYPFAIQFPWTKNENAWGRPSGFSGSWVEWHGVLASWGCMGRPGEQFWFPDEKTIWVVGLVCRVCLAQGLWKHGRSNRSFEWEPITPVSVPLGDCPSPSMGRGRKWGPWALFLCRDGLSWKASPGLARIILSLAVRDFGALIEVNRSPRRWLLANGAAFWRWALMGGIEARCFLFPARGCRTMHRWRWGPWEVWRWGNGAAGVWRGLMLLEWVAVCGGVLTYLRYGHGKTVVFPLTV